MANLPKALAQQVGKSRVAGGGNYIQHGDYVMSILRYFYQKIQDECVIVEISPAEAKKKVVFEGEKKIEEEPNPVASECSSTANFDGDGKLSAPANARAPVLAIFGFKESEVPDDLVAETLEAVCSDAQPARFMLVGVSTFPKKIRNPKSPDRQYLTGLNWECVDKPIKGDSGYVFTGINAPDKVKARAEAHARGGNEELAKVAGQQLAEFRAAGLPVVGASLPAGNTPALPAASVPALPGAIPALPGVVPSLPVIPAAPTIESLMAAGWVQHPHSADYMFRGEVLKTKIDLLAGK